MRTTGWRGVLAVVTLLLVLGACSRGAADSSTAVVPSGYQTVEAEGAGFAVPDGWLMAPDDLPERSGVVAAGGGDYEDGIPHLVRLRRYDDADTIDALEARLVRDADGDDAVEAGADSVSVPGADEAVRLSGVHRAEMGPTVGGPPLYWVSDHVLAVTSDGPGYVLTVSTARQRDDAALRARILETFHIE